MTRNLINLIDVKKDVLDRTIKNSMNLIDKEKVECWKLQKFKWTRSQIVIIFCLDNWQATNLLKKVITNIYISFVFVEILTSFRNHFVSFYKFMIHHSICISWLNSDHSTAKHLDLFYSNSNISKYSLYSDCHEKEITYHRKCHCNLEQSYILVFISRNEMYFFFETWEKIMQRMLCSARLTRTSKSIEMINFHDDEYEFSNFRRWQITFLFLIDNEYFSIFDFNKFVNILSFTPFDMSFSRLDIILYILNLLSISNLIFYFSDCATYHICVIRSKQLSFLTILSWL